MQDPFADKSNSNFHREIQVWVTVLMCLLVAFLYLAIKRMTGSHDEIPAHILQSGVAQVAPPIEYDQVRALQSKPPHVSSVPPMQTSSVSVNTMPAKPSPVAKTNPIVSPKKPDFGFVDQRKRANAFPRNSPKPMGASLQPAKLAGLKNAPLSFPKPTFIESKKIEMAEAEAKAEAIGRQRAKQLAALTSGLPERLNRIQSSVKQATAELPLPGTAAKNNPPIVADNGFAPSSPLKPVAEAPRKPVIPLPKPLVVNEPVKAVEPNAIRPAVEKTFAVKPLVPSPARAPILSPAAKEAPQSNSFVPLPLPKPIATPGIPKVAVENPSMPKIVQQDRTPKEIAKSVKPESKQYVVRAGDSFFTIAQQHYGDAQWFRALRLANQAAVNNGDELPVGTSLTIPTTAELVRQFPEHAVRTVSERPTEAQQRIYVTKAGDTLFDIARHKTGQGSRFSEIISSNEFRLPAHVRASDQLPEGLRLVLPESTLQ